MRRALGFLFSIFLVPVILFAQNGQQQPSSQQEADKDDVIRISTALVQADVVVTDKTEHIVPDLKLSDFELYENGKKQDIKFMEFVSVDTDRRTEGERPVALPPGAEIPHDLTAKELKRVVAFVVDDLTIPFADMPTVRQLLLNFVDNEMRDGDLVAIVRVIGGKGLLQQFTSDRQLLRRAIASLNISTNPYMAFNNTAPDRFNSNPALAGSTDGGAATADISAEEQGLTNLNDPNEETQRLFRGLMTLTTANFVVDSLREIPGRKSLVLISGGIPIFETSSGSELAYSNFSYLLNQLTDHAIRAGVVINTMDPRGLKATPGVAGFEATPAKSGLDFFGGAADFGRGGGADQMFGLPLAGGAEHLGLATVAAATGGVNVVNTNNFKEGLDKVLARSKGYYLLAYTPIDKFDNKFRKIEIKVKRDGVRIYAHSGYVARNERSGNAPRTKEELIISAAKSPIARRDVDVSANLNLKPSPAKAANELDIHLLIEASKLNFAQSAEGKYQTSFDVVGFVYDQMGKVRGGFSETVNANLTPESYKEALRTGLTYSASTKLPPGYFQIRAAVRETSTGNIGTISRYVEIPDLSNGRLAMSTIFLFAADTSQSKATPTPLLAARQVSQKQDLRYAALIYNAKDSGGNRQLTSQTIITQGSKVVFKEPEQPVPANGAAPITKIGQLGLAGVAPGRYMLTLVVTDQLADKKTRTVARSIDFVVAK